MRLTTILLVIAFVPIGPAGYGQITLKEKNVPVEKVLAAIEKQTKYVFLYDPEDLKVGPITIDVKNTTLKETLEKCFKGMLIEWTVMGNNVLLKKRRTLPIPYNELAETNVIQNQGIKTTKINDYAAPGSTNWP